MLAELLTEHKDWIVQYHEHDSLLENKVEEELTEEERKAAWEEYEQDKKGLLKPPPQGIKNSLFFKDLVICFIMLLFLEYSLISENSLFSFTLFLNLMLNT